MITVLIGEISMSLREKVTEAMAQHSPIQQDKADIKKKFYYAKYEDNLF